MARKYRQGTFKPKNPRKYRGNVSNIVYRSSWERIVFNYLDNSPNCIQWSSEEFVIPYVSPLDGNIHRYFVDIACVMMINGKPEKWLIEIKPYAQTLPPVSTRGKSKRTLLEESATYAVNQAKWDAAQAYCDKHGIKFHIFTEYEIGLKKKQ